MQHSTTRRATRGIVLFIVLAALVLAAFPAFAEVAPKGTTCKIYTVTLKGKVAGMAFERTGKLGIYTPGLSAKNKQEIWLASGNPWNSPTKGAITMTSNVYLAASAPEFYWQFWMGQTTKSGSPATYKYTPDHQTILQLLSQAHVFSFGTQMSQRRSINMGSLEVTMQAGNKLTGKVKVWDKFMSTEVYNATITGSLKSVSNSSTCQFNNF